MPYEVSRVGDLKHLGAYEVYGCCGREFAGTPEDAQSRLLEHIHTEHATDPDLGGQTDLEHLTRTRF